jgi:hypothetical protein
MQDRRDRSRKRPSWLADIVLPQSPSHPVQIDVGDFVGLDLLPDGLDTPGQFGREAFMRFDVDLADASVNSPVQQRFQDFGFRALYVDLEQRYRVTKAHDELRQINHIYFGHGDLQMRSLFHKGRSLALLDVINYAGSLVEHRLAICTAHGLIDYRYAWIFGKPAVERFESDRVGLEGNDTGPVAPHQIGNVADIGAAINADRTRG